MAAGAVLAVALSASYFVGFSDGSKGGGSLVVAGTPVTVNEIVRNYAEQARANLPSGVRLDIWLDRSEIFDSRANMLLTSGSIGLLIA